MQDSSFSQDTSFSYDIFQRFKLWVWILVHFNYWGWGNNTWSFEILLGKYEILRWIGVVGGEILDQIRGEICIDWNLI